MRRTQYTESGAVSGKSRESDAWSFEGASLENSARPEMAFSAALLLASPAGSDPPISFPQVGATLSQKVTPARPGLNTTDGATPNIARKVRVRCAESANPAR